VNNFDTGETLLSRVCECYDDMLRSYERGSWGIVVVRAREVVIMSFKGLLKMMGVEYSKIHGLGAIFGIVCIKRGLKVKSKELDQLRHISSALTDGPDPSLDMEKTYSKEDADKAKADAEKVLNFARSFAKTLEN
jgi:HEPN domain-containing protein